MPSLEEMTSWSFLEVVEEAERLLPQGWTLLAEASSEGYYEVSVNRMSDDGPVTEFYETHVDRRLAALNIYGALLSRKALGSPGPNWTPKAQLTRRLVSLKSAGIPEPEDLDPLEVESVYLSHRGKK